MIYTLKILAIGVGLPLRFAALAYDRFRLAS